MLKENQICGKINILTQKKSIILKLVNCNKLLALMKIKFIFFINNFKKNK